MESLPVRALGKTARSAQFQLFIPYTNRKLAVRALRAALDLGRNLNAQVSLVAVQVVPFPCPLDHSTVDLEHLKRPLAELIESADMPVQARVILARNWEDGLRSALKPGSLVLIGVKRRLWRTAEEKLARGLSRLGHSVALLEA
jgi:hypothetical protein